MKTEYGIPVPRGVPKDWTARRQPKASGGSYLRGSVPADWGDPCNWVTWSDRFGRTRLVVGHYSNGRSGARPEDDFDDLYPGTGAVTEAWRTWRGLFTLPEGKAS